MRSYYQAFSRIVLGRLAVRELVLGKKPARAVSYLPKFFVREGM